MKSIKDSTAVPVTVGRALRSNQTKYPEPLIDLPGVCCVQLLILILFASFLYGLFEANFFRMILDLRRLDGGGQGPPRGIVL